MSNGNHINIIKRDGKSEHLNIDKIHKVVMHACEGLAGVSSSQIEMNANIQFYDGMATHEIQDILIRSANDLISLDAPNYQYAAARLLSYATYKQVFGEYKSIPLKEIIKLKDRCLPVKKYYSNYTDKKKNWLSPCGQYGISITNKGPSIHNFSDTTSIDKIKNKKDNSQDVVLSNLSINSSMSLIIISDLNFKQ